MLRNSSIAFLLLVSTAMGSAWPAAAAQVSVYRWVDTDGVTHFSQTPAPAGTTGVETLTLNVPAPAVEPPAPDTAELQLQALQQRVQALEQQLQAQPAPQPAQYAPPPSPTESYVAYPAPIAVVTRRWRHRDHHHRRGSAKPVGALPPFRPAPDLYRVPPAYYSTIPHVSRALSPRPAASDLYAVH